MKDSKELKIISSLIITMLLLLIRRTLRLTIAKKILLLILSLAITICRSQLLDHWARLGLKSFKLKIKTLLILNLRIIIFLVTYFSLMKKRIKPSKELKKIEPMEKAFWEKINLLDMINLLKHLPILKELN
jgi:hypothetical protein